MDSEDEATDEATDEVAEAAVVDDVVLDEDDATDEAEDPMEEDATVPSEEVAEVTPPLDADVGFAVGEKVGMLLPTWTGLPLPVTGLLLLLTAVGEGAMLVTSLG